MTTTLPKVAVNDLDEVKHAILAVLERWNPSQPNIEELLILVKMKHPDRWDFHFIAAAMLEMQKESSLHIDLETQACSATPTVNTASRSCGNPCVPCDACKAALGRQEVRNNFAKVFPGL